jgi:sec-independent protein translocase protein TatA
MTSAFFGLPGHWEWLIILVIVLLLFGNRIPGMARALGSGITEFKKGLKGEGEGGKPDQSRSPEQSRTPEQSRGRAD